ncbi:MAG: radical SAM protein [Nitrospinae bacterium]|nr:radical SAM protein [Nitrospinota bacterium]
MAFETYVISWNVTKRCGLRCEHCYLDAYSLSGETADELSLDECRVLIGQMAEINPQACLILTGGEPLLRPDIFDIASCATAKGFMVVVGSGGNIIDGAMARRLSQSGVKGVGVSIDSLDPETHDRFRGVPGALNGTLQGIEALKREGLDFQIQTTVSTRNINEIGSIIKFAHELGAVAFNCFFLVCTGRGEELTDITPEQYEEVLKFLYNAHGKYPGMMVRAKCAPHFKRVAYQADPDSPLLKGYVGGCRAGTNYCRISPEGEVTPCPYMSKSAGNVRERSFAEIWRSSSLFGSLRRPKYNGKCEDCEFKLLCGGCRARALAKTGDCMGEDFWCVYNPEKGGAQVVNIATEIQFDLVQGQQSKNNGPRWTVEAEDRLKRVPFFARSIARRGVEDYALSNGIPVITPELMDKVREKFSSSFGKRIK